VKFILQNRLNIKKLKVGHAGTLDPLATGVMIICTGKETRNIEQYQSLPKTYLTRITLGATTPSFDLETDIDARFPTAHITLELVGEVLSGMTGIQQQEPPVYSALFIKGKRSYTLARKGKTADLGSREIVIHKLDLIRFENPLLEIRVVCSKGTYIRALARDIGLKLGSGAHLTGLTRTSIGSFTLNDALGIEDFERNFMLK